MVLGQRRAQERSQVLLVARARHDEVGQRSLGRDREHALVARPVFAHQASAVDGEQHRRVVLAHVVDGLVERALEERRVQGDDGPHARKREPCRQRHRMLLRDPDVDEPVGVGRLELVEAGAGGHPRGDRDDAAVLGAQLHELLREERRVVGGLLRLAGLGRRGLGLTLGVVPE